MNKNRDNISFPVRTYSYRVYYADTDAGGVVYYAQYLRIFEQCRAYYVEDFDLTLKEMHDRGCLFFCRRAEIDYLSPAILDDTLKIKTWIREQGRSYLTFEYKVSTTRENEVSIKIAKGVTQMVCCQKKGGKLRPGRIPSWVLERFCAKNLEDFD